MDDEELMGRTRRFALAVFKLIDKLGKTKSAHIISNQLGRAASAVAANYRSTCRSRSHKEFTARIGVVEEESDESYFWLGLLKDSNEISSEEIDPLIKESNELTAIFTASAKTAKERNATN